MHVCHIWLVLSQKQVGEKDKFQSWPCADYSDPIAPEVVVWLVGITAASGACAPGPLLQRFEVRVLLSPMVSLSE